MKRHHTKRELSKEPKRREVQNPDGILNPPYRPPEYYLTQELLKHCHVATFLAILQRDIEAFLPSIAGHTMPLPSKLPSKSQPTANRSLGREDLASAKRKLKTRKTV